MKQDPLPVPLPDAALLPRSVPPGEREAAAALCLHAGEPAEREASPEGEPSVLEYLPLVKGLAYRLAIRIPASLSVQDLVNAGMVGLLEALRDYEPRRKNRFVTYAYIRVRGAMLDAIREHCWVPRSFRDRYKRYVHAIRHLAEVLGREPEAHEIQQELGMTETEFETFLENARPLSFLSMDELQGPAQSEAASSEPGLASREPDPQECAERMEVRRLLARAIDALPKREKLVVQLYYYEYLSLKEIGKVFGVSESRVCQLHTQAIMRLKGRLGRTRV